jgi:hypothetical protein
LSLGEDLVQRAAYVLFWATSAVDLTSDGLLKKLVKDTPDERRRVRVEGLDRAQGSEHDA